MVPDDVCAVVVTFHPDGDVLENLTKLRQQIGRIVVVDNASSHEEVAMLRSASTAIGFHLVENGSNLGIATALNLGITSNEARKSLDFFLFDQDSCVTDGFAETMLRYFHEAPNRDHLGILMPCYLDKRLGTPLDAIREIDGRVQTAITSGSLIANHTFEEHGLFVDDLFIDGVDHEYSLRIRAAGLTIEECSSAILLHSPGTPTSHRLIRAKPYVSANYSSIRRYYQERNKVWLIRRYWQTFPDFCKRQVMLTVKDLAKIILFEENRMSKCRYILRGWWHGVRGRMGRLD